ncbi:hypothetical protein [Mariniflexile sp.]|uniref:hypothetical protein n=1 Tax=Mariniflexile sp. TaxID=1979402 RepID=UPI003568F9EE
MKFLSIVFCCICLFSCKDDKEEVDCSLLDFANPSLFIKLLDANGNNLIENKVYNSDDISIIFNGYTMTNVVIDNVESLENLIVLNLIGVEGNNIFEIKLSDTETDTLIMNLTVESKYCGWTFLKLNSVTYNDVIKTYEDFNGNFLITIIK